MKLFSKEKRYPSLIISEEKVQTLLLDKTGTKVESLAEIKLPVSVVKLGEVKNVDKLAAAIRELLISAKINQRFLVVGIPENKSYTKLLNLPHLKSAELKEAVIWEAETFLPIPIDQVYLDWKLINRDEKNELQVLIVAVPKEVIDNYTQAILQAGATPIAYETTALSLLRLVENQNKRNFIIDVGEKSAVITLANKKTMEASSIVSLESHDQEGRQNLIQTLSQMFDYYEKENQKQEKIDTIYLSGQGVTQDLLDEIKNKIQHEVKTVPIPIQNLPEKQALNFAVITSLASKIIRNASDENTINLLPPAIQKQLDLTKTNKSLKFMIVTSTVVLSALITFSLSGYFYLQTLYSSLQNQKLELPAPPAETNEAIKQINNLNQATNNIIQTGANRIFPHHRLAQILPVIPKEVVLINISFNEIQQTVRIIGRAEARTDMLNFKDSLLATGQFTDAVLPLSSLQQAKNVDFILTAKMEKYAQ